MPWTRGSLLGEGGYGRVFECLNDDGRICAAKVVTLRPGDDERSRSAQAEIEKEVELMKKLSHPNIVRYIGTERDAKELVIFLELVPAGSISAMLGKYGRFKESVVRGYCREILQGLEYLHANKILHRDIKGPNILVDFAGVCKLSDFGCSKELYGEIASTMTLKGTPQFMAPEVLRNQGQGYTDKADIWSVGCTVIEMCTAKRPWPEFKTNEAVMYHVAMRQEARPTVPEWMSAECQDFCAQCFARDPADRPKVSALLRHPLVHDASLHHHQRLGTTAADPAQISLHVRSPALDTGDGGKRGGGRVAGRVQTGVRPKAEHAPNTTTQSYESEAQLGAPGRRKVPMGGVVLREDSDDEDDEDSCSSDDGDEDEGRTPAADKMHSLHARKGIAATAPRGLAPGASGMGPHTSSDVPAASATRRALPESLVVDIQSALRMVEQAHDLVQSVTSNRQKCFSLAQKMRRAKIPLEKLIDLDRAHDEVRHAVMDIRDCLENSMELMRRHGTAGWRGFARLWACFFQRDTAAEFIVQEDELARVLEVLHEICASHDVLLQPPMALATMGAACDASMQLAMAGDGGGELHTVRTGEALGSSVDSLWEPPLWSRRILRGDRSEMRSLVLDSQRQLWCGTRALRIYQADARKLVQTCRANFGLVRAIIEVPGEGGRQRRIWTAHSDGRIRIWDPENVVQIEEVSLSAAAGARSSVMCLLYYAREPGDAGEVWAGTAAGRIWRIAVGCAGAACSRSLTRDQGIASGADRNAAESERAGVVEVVRSHVRHQGAIRCMLRVGHEVWSGSYSGEIVAWDAMHADLAHDQPRACHDRMLQSHDRMPHTGHGAVKSMAYLHPDLVLTGHRSGSIQIWTVEGVKQANASAGASVKCAVQAGGLAWTGHSDGYLRLWSLVGNGLELYRVVRAHKTAILAMVSDSQSVWSCTKNGTLRQWSIGLLLQDEAGRARDSGALTMGGASAAAWKAAPDSRLATVGKDDIKVPVSLRHAELLASVSEALCPGQPLPHPSESAADSQASSRRPAVAAASIPGAPLSRHAARSQWMSVPSQCAVM